MSTYYSSERNNSSNNYVEINPFGRFIDFSLSTNFEKSVLNCENLMKKLFIRNKNNDSESHTYLDTKLKICLHCEDSEINEIYLSSLFDVEEKYLLVSRPGNNWLDCTTSVKYSLYSSLVTALHTLGDECSTYPMFFMVSNEYDISLRTVNIFGYQIYRQPFRSIIVNYSSIQRGPEEHNEDFQYVDNLAQLFQDELLTCHHCTTENLVSLSKNFFVQVTELASVQLNPSLYPIKLWATKTTEGMNQLYT